MKSIKLQLLLVLFALFVTTSCEKDESSVSPNGNAIVGRYFFESEEIFGIRKWIVNGLEVTPDSSDMNYMFSESSFHKGVNYEFTSNFKVLINEKSSTRKDTSDYKIKNNIIFIALIDNPQNDEDYVPQFVISNDKLFSYHHGFLYRYSTGSNGIFVLKIDSNYNVFDAGLTQINMQNVSQLKTGEDILTSYSRYYFSRK